MHIFKWDLYLSTDTSKYNLTDLGTVMIASSLSPFTINIRGIADLTAILARVEEKIRADMLLKEKDRLEGITPDEYQGLGKEFSSYLIPSIVPNYESWIVSSWHFGIDFPIEYRDENFLCTFYSANEEFCRTYTKKMTNGESVLREEVLETPKVKVMQALEKKLKDGELPVQEDFGGLFQS